MSSMSKRAQARTERELQEILSLPGNSICADCGARNPAWASWSIGIFLCMRCATLHRKLGTHISKVKSLTMDTWSDEQVQNMRKNGNNTANQLYNPRNKKPDMPLDADEVDNAMERFIRKKYQEKSLSDGRPEVPSRDDPPVSRSKSPDISASPPLPPKKKGFWTGFGLRASSSAYPLSKHDKKHRNEPKVDSAFRVSSEDYTSKSKTDSRVSGQKDISTAELEVKLAQLRDMGFTNNERNAVLLKKARGDVELVIASLVKHGGQPDNGQERAGSPAGSKMLKQAPEAGQNGSRQAETVNTTNNPFDALDRLPQQQGNDQLQSQTVTQAATLNNNPWQAVMYHPQSTGLEQSFAGMQVNARPLFPHNTGGYMTQPDPRFTQSMTPPVPSMPQAYSAATSPINSTNPFLYQTPLSAHSTGSNPYASNMQTPPSFAPSTNPFILTGSSVSQPTSPSLSNPFGLPPQQTQTQPDLSFPTPNNQMPALPLQQVQSSHLPAQTMSSDMTSPEFPNFAYGQPVTPFQNQTQLQQGAPGTQFSYTALQQQQHLMTQQQPARYDKNSIMALYSHPQFAQQRPLAAIPEPAETDQKHQEQNFVQAAGHQIQHNNANNTMRSVSVPLPATSVTSPDQLSRNPFFANTTAVTSNMTTSNQSTPSLPQFSPLGQNNPYSTQPLQTKQMASGNPFGSHNGPRHTSADSMSVNNPALLDGRHSPDAWGGLSARYVR